MCKKTQGLKVKHVKLIEGKFEPMTLLYQLSNRISRSLPTDCSYSVQRNLVMDDVQEMARELEMFRAAGGATVCELSCIGVRCSPHSPGSLAQLSRLSGVHIVHVTGFYCHTFLPETVHRMSVHEMTQTMMDEVSQCYICIYTLSPLELNVTGFWKTTVINSEHDAFNHPMSK